MNFDSTFCARCLKAISPPDYTFAFSPLKTQTQPQNRPTRHCSCYFGGCVCVFDQAHNHNERTHNRRSQQRKVMTCPVDPPRRKFFSASSLTPTRLKKPSKAHLRQAPSRTRAQPLARPLLCFDFGGLCLCFHPTPPAIFGGCDSAPLRRIFFTTCIVRQHI